MWLIRRLPNVNSWFYSNSAFAYVARVCERLGVIFYNEVISRTSIGLRDPRWNPRIHGVYLHHRHYGKLDKKLFDVKLCDLGAWIGRREKSPAAVVREIQRNIGRITYIYLSPMYECAVKQLFRISFTISFLVWLVYNPYYQRRRQALYHW